MAAMNKSDVLGILQEHGAVVPGHFQMATGLHSPIYIQTAMVLQYPHVAHKIARALAAKFPQECDVVVALGTSSIILGQELARVKKCRAIFAEKTGGALALRRDFKLERGEKALLIQDVLASGGLVAEMAALARARGAKTLGVGALVDRSEAALCLDIPVRALVSYPLEASPEKSCPQCASGVPLTKARQAPGPQEGE